MRLSITFDSATTEEARALLGAMSKVADLRNTTVWLNGPEKWAGQTQFVHGGFAELAAIITEADLRTVF
jgi:hypothetical protein